MKDQQDHIPRHASEEFREALQGVLRHPSIPRIRRLLRRLLAVSKHPVVAGVSIAAIIAVGGAIWKSRRVLCAATTSVWQFITDVQVPLWFVLVVTVALALLAWISVRSFKTSLENARNPLLLSKEAEKLVWGIPQQLSMLQRTILWYLTLNDGHLPWEGLFYHLPARYNVDHLKKGVKELEQLGLIQSNDTFISLEAEGWDLVIDFGWYHLRARQKRKLARRRRCS